MIVHNVTQGSPEWLQVRTGLPTASSFSKIVTSTGEASKSRIGYAKTLAAEIYAGKPMESWGGNEWTDRGKDLEAEAIARYELQNDVDVAHVGFVTLDDGTAGCSPDGLVGDRGLVEVKCLKAENHIDAMLYFDKHGKCPTDYIQQTQGQMWITGRTWADLIFYHPDLPLVVIRQEPIYQVVGGLAAGIKDLITERDQIVEVMRGRNWAQAA